ncbi:MAG: hypothetical protein ABI832_08345 [bacterium]
MRHLAACLFALLATSATAQTQPDYSDNRSTPADVVTSLYNAINRHEYLRGYSYFRDGAIPDFQAFETGYQDTDHVDLRMGEVTGDGAAGSYHSQVPVAIRAVDSAGRSTVYTGCYRLTQVQPAIQEVPPFRPIQIDEGHLAVSRQPFESAMGQCN